MLTDRQIEVADHLLAGLDHAQIEARMQISGETLKGHLRDMRKRLDADGHQQLMGRLREMRRNPVDAMLERCRAAPRQWFTL